MGTIGMPSSPRLIRRGPIETPNRITRIPHDFSSPRLIRRGPIETDCPPDRVAFQLASPRLIRRGPIETEVFLGEGLLAHRVSAPHQARPD